MAFLGVRKPRPTSLYHLRPPLPGRALFALVLEFWKMCGCFWKARSLWTVNSVALWEIKSAFRRQCVLLGRGRTCWMICLARDGRSWS